MHTQGCVCMYVYIYIYTHTHTHTHWYVKSRAHIITADYDDIDSTF